MVAGFSRRRRKPGWPPCAIRRSRTCFPEERPPDPSSGFEPLMEGHEWTKSLSRSTHLKCLPSKAGGPALGRINVDYFQPGGASGAKAPLRFLQVFGSLKPSPPPYRPARAALYTAASTAPTGAPGEGLCGEALKEVIGSPVPSQNAWGPAELATCRPSRSRRSEGSQGSPEDLQSRALTLRGLRSGLAWL